MYLQQSKTSWYPSYDYRGVNEPSWAELNLELWFNYMIQLSSSSRAWGADRENLSSSTKSRASIWAWACLSSLYTHKQMDMYTIYMHPHHQSLVPSMLGSVTRILFHHASIVLCILVNQSWAYFWLGILCSCMLTSQAKPEPNRSKLSKLAS